MHGREAFPDLLARIVTGASVAVVGLGAVWAGRLWFAVFVAVIISLLVWELARMLGADAARAMALGVVAGVVLLAAKLAPAGLSLPLLVVPALVGLGLMGANRPLFMLVTTLIMLASFGMMTHRDEFGLVWMLWLVLVVVSTDILGYFAGRLFGGPKFWPRISPKKTWSGTVAGWIGAAVIGAIFMAITGASVALIALSIAVSFAGQMGDIAESAVKRRAGVKDSSTLLPGHGGIWDRFDGMLGASLFLLLVESTMAFPPMEAL